MCDICNRIKNLIDAKDPTEDALRVMETAIKDGTPPEHFKPLLDKLLGTELAERDTDVEQRWENGYRNRYEEE